MGVDTTKSVPASTASVRTAFRSGLCSFNGRGLPRAVCGGGLWHIAVVLATAVVAGGCDSGASEADAAASDALEGEGGATGHFDAPQDVIVHDGRWVFVVNSGFEPTTLGFGEGALTVVDAEAGAWVATHPLGCANAQFAAAHEGSVYVVCTGATAYDTTVDLNVALEPGALLKFAVDDLTDPSSPAQPAASLEFEAPEDHPLWAGPGSIVLSPAGDRAWIGSGLAPVVFAVDVAAMAFAHPTGEPTVLPSTPEAEAGETNDTITLHWHPAGELVAASFNTDSLFRLDPDTLGVIGEGVDVGQGEFLEGPIALATSGEATSPVWAVMTLASSVSEWVPELGALGAKARLFATGGVANDLVVSDDAFFVANSGDNNLLRVERGSLAATLPFATFPPTSNPYSMALGAWKGEAALFVSLFAADSLAVVSAESGGDSGDAPLNCPLTGLCALTSGGRRGGSSLHCVRIAVGSREFQNLRSEPCRTPVGPFGPFRALSSCSSPSA